MTSARYLGHVTLPDGCDWLKSAADFPLSIDQTLLLQLTVGITPFQEPIFSTVKQNNTVFTNLYTHSTQSYNLAISKGLGKL